MKTAEILTRTGFKTVELLPAEIVCELSLIDNLALAKAMGKAGATIYLYRLAGYEVKAKSPEPTIYDYAKALIETKDELLALTQEKLQVTEYLALTPGILEHYHESKKTSTIDQYGVFSAKELMQEMAFNGEIPTSLKPCKVYTFLAGVYRADTLKEPTKFVDLKDGKHFVNSYPESWRSRAVQLIKTVARTAY